MYEMVDLCTNRITASCLIKCAQLFPHLFSLLEGSLREEFPGRVTLHWSYLVHYAYYPGLVDRYGNIIRRSSWKMCCYLNLGVQCGQRTVSSS